MSHLVTVKAQLRDPAAIAAACRRLGLAEPVHGTAQLFSGKATGLLVQLPGWTYPVVIDTTRGEAAFDNYGGTWGDSAKIDQFLQAYAVEVVRLEARRKGYAVTEQALPDGSIRLEVLMEA